MGNDYADAGEGLRRENHYRKRRIVEKIEKKNAWDQKLY